MNRKIKSSKTECVFFPPPQFFNNLAPALEDSLVIEEVTVEEGMSSNNRVDALQEARETARVAQEDDLYDQLEETKQINVTGGFVTFCKHFKYLGSHVSYNLRDDYDIETRIAAANSSMGALKNFWHNPHVDMYSKFLIYRAIPTNLLIWGCETWALRKGLLRKLEVFLHHSVRSILNISMS